MKTFTNRINTPLAIGLLAVATTATNFIVPSRAAEQPLTPQEGAARMQAARNEIAVTRTNIVLTVEQLHLLRTSQNPQAQFQKFTNQLAVTEERAQLTRQHAQAMISKGDAYFADWEAQIAGIQDPQRRQQVQESYAKRKKSYERITQCLRDAGNNFTPLLSMLKEIQSLLEGEKSQEKVAEAKELFSRANWRCTEVQRSLMQAESEFESLAADFAGKK